MRRLPAYAFAGLAIIVVSEVAMLLEIEPLWSWHTPISWTGYIMLVDGLVFARRGDSWLTRSPREFTFLAVVSIPLWLVFEWFNLFIENWRYINLPESPFWRNFGYAWAFATIWPAIFESAELVATLRNSRSGTRASAASRVGQTTPGLRALLVASGAAMLAWPILWPSPYLAALVWLGFIPLLDPLNRLRGESLLGDLQQGRRDRLTNLLLAGMLCGVLWEFWNYWARAKWIYTVPIMSDLKIFEMPLPGYLGFPAFALGCFTMYEAVRLLLWRGRRRPLAL